MRSSLRRSLPLALAGLAVLALLAGSPAGAALPQNGERIVITGIVTDGQGLPLPQVQVSLEAARSVFNLKTFHREKQGLQRLTTTTNERGEYSIDWPWSDYYNVFELTVGIPVRRGQAEKVRVLERLDITSRLSGGSPVVAALAVQDTTFLKELRDFLASIKTDDERQVYGAMGQPDRIDRLQYPSSLDSTWWYFEAGKAYRFRDGKLVETTAFDPIRQF